MRAIRNLLVALTIILVVVLPAHATSAPTDPAFNVAANFVLQSEGGYVANDAGQGPTKYGISQAANPGVDIKNLTVDQAKAIYYEKYWLPAGCDKLPDPDAIAVFDFAINSGISRAVQTYKDSSNLQDFFARRLLYLASLPSWKVYGAGWTNRIARLMQLTGAIQQLLNRPLE